jgi:integrase
MPRKVRDSNLETRSARSRLKVAHKPYFRLIEPGLHLGYRKLASGPGTWIVRRYGGAGKYTVKNLTTADDRLIVADDFSDPDGKTILSFAQAQERAKAHRAAIDTEGDGGPYTVAMAMDDYIAFLEAHRKTAADARYRDRAFIRPTLGTIEVAKLTTKKIRDWLADLAKQPPRLRTRKDKDQKFKAVESDDESVRRRQSSANRTFTVLKAALNLAWREGKVPSDAAWRRVKPFKGVDAARIRYLTLAEAKRLINASAHDFRRLVEGALQTGARYGELTRLLVSDFNPDSGTLAVRMSKSGKPRHVVLTDEGVEFFKSICAGRSRDELMFIRADGNPWLKSYQARPMIESCKAAKLTPAIGFHGLRHTWASHAVMNGVPLLIVAKNLGHSDTRMVERHYGHMSPSHVADAIRAGAPTFGFKAERKVVSIDDR